MAASINKAPDANDTRITFDIPKALAPFVREWLADRQRDGELRHDFICRMACEEGVRHVMTMKIAEFRADRDDAQTIDQAAIGVEYGDILKGYPMNEITIPAHLLQAVIGTLGQIKSARGMTVSDIQGLQAQLQQYAQKPLVVGEKPTGDIDPQIIAAATAAIEAAAKGSNGA